MAGYGAGWIPTGNGEGFEAPPAYAPKKPKKPNGYIEPMAAPPPTSGDPAGTYWRGPGNAPGIESDRLAREKFNFAKDQFGSLRALLSQGGPTLTPPNLSGGAGGGFSSDDELAAETAALTRAKERTGQRAAGSLKALSGYAADRGITGSGIQARNARDIVQGAASDMAGVEGDLIQGRLGRRERAAAFGEEQRQFNNNYALQVWQAQQSAASTRLNQLLSVYGMMY